MDEQDRTPEDAENSALEETARERLGVESWDRPLIFRETAEAATDNRLPYWSMIFLSGAIATLGLALDNAAVVIGAMLIAPLLAPVMGLALALAVGDIRLASQTGMAVIVSTTLVVLTAMLLTLVLPFHTFTSEITARTRPTTLDLGIAVFSGLAGVVVSVTRRKGLSAAIPGVAVAVALIPPLAVAGFSAGAEFRWPFIRGSMLLYGANLAGIVFSGTAVFLLIGMHRPDVIEAAATWHANTSPTRMGAWAARTRWWPRIVSIRSPMARIGLVVAFVTALGIPLTITLAEIARETRIQRALRRASEIFEVEGRSSIISLEPVIGETESRAVLRVATTEWFGDDAHDSFERIASAQAGESVHLVLEQLPTTSGDLQELADLFPARRQVAEPPRPADLRTTLMPARERIDEALAGLSVPDAIRTVGTEVVLGGDLLQLTVGYAGVDSMSSDVRQILSRQLRSALDEPALAVAWQHVSTDTLELTGAPADSTRLRELSAQVQRFGDLRLAVLADTMATSERTDSTIARLIRHGVDRGRISLSHQDDRPLRLVPYVSSE